MKAKDRLEMGMCHSSSDKFSTSFDISSGLHMTHEGYIFNETMLKVLKKKARKYNHLGTDRSPPKEIYEIISKCSQCTVCRLVALEGRMSVSCGGGTVMAIVCSWERKEQNWVVS